MKRILNKPYPTIIQPLKLLFFRKLRVRLPSKILVCFSVSLSALLILFLGAMDRTEDKVACQVVAGLIQYFMLCVFSWMAVNAVSLYQAIVLVFRRNDSKFFLRASIGAWGKYPISSLRCHSPV